MRYDTTWNYMSDHKSLPIRKNTSFKLFICNFKFESLGKYFNYVTSKIRAK